jgi:hypothetical protein
MSRPWGPWEAKAGMSRPLGLDRLACRARLGPDMLWPAKTAAEPNE